MILISLRIVQKDNIFKNKNLLLFNNISIFIDILLKIKIKLINSIFYKPSINKCIKKFNKTLKQIIFIMFLKIKTKYNIL